MSQLAKRPDELPFDDQLKTAATLVVRARIFFDINWFYEGLPTRGKILESMNRYSEFFRYDSHAHHVAFVVHIATLFDNRKDVISLPRLAGKARQARLIDDRTMEIVQNLLNEALVFSNKVVMLRNNLFAHRSAHISNRLVYEQANVTSDQLRELTDCALSIVNFMLVARGQKEVFFHTPPVDDAAAMLASFNTHD